MHKEEETDTTKMSATLTLNKAEPHTPSLPLLSLLTEGDNNKVAMAMGMLTVKPPARLQDMVSTTRLL